jgi:RimJ/RimL family protein N-acetyltransferase
LGGGDVRGRFALVATQDANAVGLIDVETYDDGTAGIALVVDPERRGRGLGKAILSALFAAPQLSDVSVVRAGTELANEASVRCLAAARFVRETTAPDADGVVYFGRTLGSAS